MSNNSKRDEQPRPGPSGDKPDAAKAGKLLGAMGAAKGGIARSNSLTPQQRKEIARQAVRARWIKAGKIPKTDEDTPENPPSGPKETGTSGDGPKRPFSMFRGEVMLGNRKLECHVLNDLRRVLTQREVVRAISTGSDSEGRESGNLGRYLQRNPLTADGKFDAGPVIEFDVPGTSQVANGYEATLLIEICDKYLEAKEQGLLKPSQYKLVAQAGIIMRACAKLGIIALIDEATGFQQHRARNALQLKIQAFIVEELQEWARMFPEEFWLELARMEGIHYSPRNRPLRWGKYVMMFVYDAIDSDIGKELRAKNPNPKFQRNHHQWMTKYGRDRVNNQIQRVIAVMKMCDNMDDFRKKFARVFKRAGYQPGLFDDLDM